MKLLNPLYRNWRLLLAALVAAIVVHIGIILVPIHKDEVASYTRLASQLPLNQISYLPEMTPQNQKLPFMMPDIRYAACRFDARDNIVRVRAEIPAPGWSLSFHAPNGDNFLFVPGTYDRVIKLNIEINQTSKTFETKSIGRLDEKKKSPLISIKQPRGIAIFKAPINALALRRRADEQLNTFECYTER